MFPCVAPEAAQMASVLGNGGRAAGAQGGQANKMKLKRRRRRRSKRRGKNFTPLGPRRGFCVPKPGAHQCARRIHGAAAGADASPSENDPETKIRKKGLV